ncbi:MAG: hypothetical protein JST86_15925 [Bacteroidetes bacterium]|nr:hypothetical protein [Bacteroidota bacterium]
MSKKIFFTFLMFLFFASTKAQTWAKGKQFFCEDQWCSLIGITDDYYCMDCKDDSTVELLIYHTSFEDRYQSVTEEKLTGVYVVHGDSIQVLSKTSIYTYKTKNTGINKSRVSVKPDSVHNAELLLTQTLTFIYSNGKLVEMNEAWPPLDLLVVDKISILKNEFDQWDKPSSGSKAIFGL